MNNLIKPIAINVLTLIRNSNKFSEEFNSNLIDEIKLQFTEEEQQWYVANLYMYINYHATNDYIINLEDVFKMIGFANKGNAKKTLESNFVVNEDYKSSFLPKDKPSWGGSGNEEILLNIDTFKNLCMLAKTDKGKEIRKYYVKLENVNNKVITEEINKQKSQLIEKDNLLEKAQIKLETIQKLQTSKWSHLEKGDMIYCIKSHTGFIKIGKTKNIKDREGHYACDQVGDMFYVKKCHNCDLTEKVIHHMLNKKKLQSNKEWFEISNETAIYYINLVCDFLDNFINHIENITESNLLENLDNSLCILKEKYSEINTEIKPEIIIQLPEVKVEFKIDKKVQPKSNIKAQQKIDREKEDKIYREAEIRKNKRPKNIACTEDTISDFIKECCELSDNSHVLTYNFHVAYKIWNKGLGHRGKKTLLAYMDKTFITEKKHYQEFEQTDLDVYLGIKLKEITIETKNVEFKYTQFISSNFKFDYSYRIKTSEFDRLFKEWLNSNYPDYIFMATDKSDLDNYIYDNFLRESINVDGNAHIDGILGLQLKSDNTLNLGLNLSLRKKVAKIDINTNETLEIFNSLLLASNPLNVSTMNFARYIRKKKVFDNQFIYKYIESNHNRYKDIPINDYTIYQ